MNILRFLDLISALDYEFNQDISDEIANEVLEKIKEGFGYTTIFEDIKKKHGYELSFSLFKDLEGSLRGYEEGRHYVSVYPEGSPGDMETGYGGDRPGVFIAPSTASLNFLEVTAEEVIQTEIDKLEEKGFTCEEVMILARDYAEEFREKTVNYLNALHELDDFLSFVKAKIAESLQGGET